jgi:hypothetical protein
MYVCLHAKARQRSDVGDLLKVPGGLLGCHKVPVTMDLGRRVPLVDVKDSYLRVHLFSKPNGGCKG